MAESTRVVLAETDAVLARVRASIGETSVTPSTDAADASRIADEWEREALRIVHEQKLAEAATNFRQRWPALVRWRERVLKTKSRQRPSIVAAAYESLALECTLAGEHHFAAKALQAALDVMQRARRIAPTSNQAMSA